MSKHQIDELNSMYTQLSAILFIALSFTIQIIPNLNLLSKIILLFVSLICIGGIPWYISYYLPYINASVEPYLMHLKALSIYLLIIFVAGVFTILSIILPFYGIASLFPILITVAKPKTFQEGLLSLIIYFSISLSALWYFSERVVKKIVVRMFLVEFIDGLRIFENEQIPKFMVLIQYLFPITLTGLLLLPILNPNNTYYINPLYTKQDPITSTANISFIALSILLIVSAIIVMKSIGNELQKFKETNINPKSSSKIDGGAKQRGRAAR